MVLTTSTIILRRSSISCVVLTARTANRPLKNSTTSFQTILNNSNNNALYLSQSRYLSNNTSSSSSSSNVVNQHKQPNLSTLLRRLKDISTAALCDADKSLRLQSSSTSSYKGLRLLDQSIKLITPPSSSSTKLVGIARTVQCSTKNDFLAVLRGLYDSQPGEVLIVNTLNSTRAVAGELFVTEASRKGVVGLIIDGPVRDVGAFEWNEEEDIENEDDTTTTKSSRHAAVVYATGITPYSGSTQSVGDIQVTIECCGVRVDPGDIIVGDEDGVVVGSAQSGMADWGAVIDLAERIEAAEDAIMYKMTSEGRSLHEMTNYEEHLERRMKGEDSSLEFRVDLEDD